MTSAKQHIIPINGLNLSMTELGSGPLVLFCHGFPETSQSWRHQLPALADAGFRAVAPDLRGYGLSDCPSDAFEYSTMNVVGDLIGILDALGESQAVVVGSDWGATVAWHAALLRPDRFRAVAALGVPMMGPHLRHRASYSLALRMLGFTCTTSWNWDWLSGSLKPTSLGRCAASITRLAET